MTGSHWPHYERHLIFGWQVVTKAREELIHSMRSA